jgi:hypothetical protein
MNTVDRPPPGGKALLCRLTEHTSARGSRYSRGWLGGSALLAFEGEPDEQEGPLYWDLFVSEPSRPAPGAPKQGQLGLSQQL